MLNNIYYWNLDPNWIKKLDLLNMPMPLWIYRALISGTDNYNRKMQAGFKHRLAAKFKLSVVWGKLAPDLITAIHMAADIFLVNSDVVYVLIGLESRQNMSEMDSVAKRAWHWWLMLSWHYGGPCLYQQKKKKKKEDENTGF